MRGHGHGAVTATAKVTVTTLCAVMRLVTVLVTVTVMTLVTVTMLVTAMTLGHGAGHGHGAGRDLVRGVDEGLGGPVVAGEEHVLVLVAHKGALPARRRDSDKRLG